MQRVCSATRLIANRFALAAPRSAAQDDAPGTDLAATSFQDIYIHTRENPGAAATFHVKFQADSDNKWWKSTDLLDAYSKIDIVPLSTPTFVKDDYQFTRRRVDGGSGGPGGPGNPDPDKDDFDFHLRTVDYWTFAYTGRLGTEGALFETIEFLPVDGKQINISAIRYESEQLKEHMCSWTGSIFLDKQKETEIKKIEFDEATKFIIKTESLDVDVNQTYFSPGTLVISLHRSDRIDYVRDTVPERAKLSRPLKMLLIDKNGNPHRQTIDFLPVSAAEDRNHLDHTRW